MRKMLLAAVLMCTVLSAATFMGSLSVVNAQPYIQYSGGDSGTNIRSCDWTDGSGSWIAPIVNTVGVSVAGRWEIGVLEITLLVDVGKVEVYGSGCSPTATLTCNDIPQTVSQFHDSGTIGLETLTFILTTPAKTITLYTSVHNPTDNHGFDIEWIRFYYVVPVVIDIKPYSCPNSVNLNDQGRLPVAIMGSASLDVFDIDPATIRLKGVPVTTRGGGKLAVSYEDVYGDGYMDLVAFFKVQELVTADLGPATTSLTLTALYDGTPISGTDSVRIVPP